MGPWSRSEANSQAVGLRMASRDAFGALKWPSPSWDHLRFVQKLQSWNWESCETSQQLLSLRITENKDKVLAISYLQQNCEIKAA